MSEIDERLETAASEVRDIARGRRTPPVPSPSAAPRGWLAFAGAFVVVATIGLAASLLGSAETIEPGGSSTPTSHLSTPTTTTSPLESTDAPVPTCSATGVETPPAANGLPQAVADTRQAIIEAASSCSLAQLVEIAGDDLATSFGDDAGTLNLLEWEQGGRGELGTLLRILGTSYALIEPDGQPSIYVWPAAFAHDTWDEIPPDQLAELGAIYTQDELDQIAQFGSYAGWRIGIDESGKWLFFIAGD